MKKILTLLLLLIPLLANGQDWFKANAVRYAANGSEFSEWQECDINVFFDDAVKVKIYAQETHVLRKIGSTVEDEGKNGVSHIFWQAVDEKSQDCIVCVSSDGSTFMHLKVTFIKENLVICYNLIPDK